MSRSDKTLSGIRLFHYHHKQLAPTSKGLHILVSIILLDDAIELRSVQERNQLSEYIFVYVHNSLFKFGCKDTNSNPFAQFSTYNNLNFKIFKDFFLVRLVDTNDFTY